MVHSGNPGFGDSVARRRVMRSLRTRLSIVFSLLAALTLVASGGADAQDTITGIEHWVPSVSAVDGKPLKLFVWEKRQKDMDVKEYAKSGRVVLLAHGATTPGSLAFDFQLSSKTELTYSLMNYLAERGFDVFALEYQNYGRSDKHECGICVSTQVAANDINAVVDYIRSQRSVERVYLLGWS